jgi:tRNA1Val (adenine37-N6)-methyltransferase
MKNSQFNFKQFSIRQDKCSMKVGTDGVLLGAMISAEKSPKKILDIGTGTGLLALMMAQKFSSAKITAIDVDANACLQAKENSINSPWADRIEVFHSALQNYSSTQQFDCILSNPPFYQNAKKSSDAMRAQSRNEEFLPAESIFKFAQKSLSFDGGLWLIYPIESLPKLNQYAVEYGLSLRVLHYIRPNILKACHRVIVCYGRNPAPIVKTKITCIEILKRHDYTDEYKQLCNDFYLHF